MIKVAILEDDKLIRESFQAIVSESEFLELVGSFGTGEEFLSFARVHVPEVVLTDLQLPGKSGIDCIRELKSMESQVQFLVCSVFEDNENIFNAICAGATGYLLKGATPEEIEKAIISIYRGESPMSGKIARLVMASFHKPSPKRNYLDLLSVREREILSLLTEGLRYKDIAERLFLSIETVRTHIRNIYEKLQVETRTEAINKVYGH